MIMGLSSFQDEVDGVSPELGPRYESNNQLVSRQLAMPKARERHLPSQTNALHVLDPRETEQLLRSPNGRPVLCYNKGMEAVFSNEHAIYVTMPPSLSMPDMETPCSGGGGAGRGLSTSSPPISLLTVPTRRQNDVIDNVNRHQNTRQPAEHNGDFDRVEPEHAV